MDMFSKVDKYLRDGCMQCKLGATPVSQPKQAKTRIARIDKNEERIFLGKGLND